MSSSSTLANRAASGAANVAAEHIIAHGVSQLRSTASDIRNDLARQASRMTGGEKAEVRTRTGILFQAAREMLEAVRTNPVTALVTGIDVTRKKLATMDIELGEIIRSLSSPPASTLLADAAYVLYLSTTINVTVDCVITIKASKSTFLGAPYRGDPVLRSIGEKILAQCDRAKLQFRLNTTSAEVQAASVSASMGQYSANVSMNPNGMTTFINSSPPGIPANVHPSIVQTSYTNGHPSIVQTSYNNGGVRVNSITVTNNSGNSGYNNNNNPISSSSSTSSSTLIVNNNVVHSSYYAVGNNPTGAPIAMPVQIGAVPASSSNQVPFAQRSHLSNEPAPPAYSR